MALWSSMDAVRHFLVVGGEAIFFLLLSLALTLRKKPQEIRWQEDVETPKGRWKRYSTNRLLSVEERSFIAKYGVLGAMPPGTELLGTYDEPLNAWLVELETKCRRFSAG